MSTLDDLKQQLAEKKARGPKTFPYDHATYSQDLAKLTTFPYDYQTYWKELEPLENQIAELEFEEELASMTPIRQLVAKYMFDHGLYSDGGREGCSNLEDIIVALCVQSQRLPLESLEDTEKG